MNWLVGYFGNDVSTLSVNWIVLIGEGVSEYCNDYGKNAICLRRDHRVVSQLI